MNNQISNKLNENLNKIEARQKLLNIAEDEFLILIKFFYGGHKVQEYILNNYKTTPTIFFSQYNIKAQTLEWYLFWYEYFKLEYQKNERDNSYIKEIEKMIILIENICEYRLWKISSDSNGWKIIPFEELEIIPVNINNIYDLFYKFRIAKNLSERLRNLLPIIELVYSDIHEKNLDVFCGVYNKEDLSNIRKKMNAIRHAKDNTEPQNEYSIFLKGDNKIEEKENFVFHVYFLMIECFAILNKHGKI